MNIDIGDGKSAQISADKSVSIYHGSNIIFLRPIEAEKLKRWFNEVI